MPFFVDLGSKTAVVATPPPGVPAASALAAAISAALGSPVPLPLQSLLAADAAQLPAIAAELAPGGLGDGTGKCVLTVCRTVLHELQPQAGSQLCIDCQHIHFHDVNTRLGRGSPW